MKIHSGSVIVENEILSNHSVLIKDQWIVALVPEDNTPSDDNAIDASGCFVSPGWIDLHAHGAVGHDFMQPEADNYNKIAAFFAQNGVTRYLPTLMEKNDATFDETLSFLASYLPKDEAAKPIGAHLEGPYFNAKFPGDMDPSSIRAPQPQEYQNWIRSGQIRLMTIAPELDGATELIDFGIKNGVRFALGHCDPNESQVANALEKGADQISHLFNQMGGLHHRNPGLASAALMDDRLNCQIIPDEEHLHPAVIKLIFRLKQAEKLILITDSTAECGLDSNYRQPQSSAQTTIPGKLTMDQAVRNMIRFSGATLQEAVTMASFTPAAALGIENRFGSIKKGHMADLLLLDNQLNVVLTMIAGQVVFDPQKRLK
ncbi:MAG: N-acetylglucosamine-6-phosphate deacetylase [Anaerolineaceae bacterium]|nr:N-acetylglucosamine-6-phosphate deacetylase [Anaerolineaceae bacterium]